MAAVNDEPIEADRIPSETSSKKEEVKTKGKKTNKKRRIYVKPLIVTEKRTWQLDKDHVTLSHDPSPNSPIEVSTLYIHILCGLTVTKIN